MCLFFFFNDTATTEIYTLSLHDALPILRDRCHIADRADLQARCSERLDRRLAPRTGALHTQDRKSTRLNSSHGYISYAVFCLKKKKTQCRHQRHSKACSTTTARTHAATR